MFLSENRRVFVVFACGFCVLLSTSCAGLQSTPSSTLVQPDPTSTSSSSADLSTAIPNNNPEIATDWKVYTNEQYGFSFQYPNLSDTCCMIAGPAYGNAELIIALADESTVQPDTDAWFDGLAIYVVPNDENLAFDEYIKREKEALLEQREATGQESGLPRTEAQITVGGQKGMFLQGYSWDHVIKMYVPFPGKQTLLVISKTEKSEGSFEVFGQILSTFEFKGQGFSLRDSSSRRQYVCLKSLRPKDCHQG